MKSKPRRRYKKKKYDLFLVFKIALICYLAIFGVGYMSSDTSAYFSNQSEVSQTITAGTWEDPQCGEDDGNSKDAISNGENETECEDVDDKSQVIDEDLTGEIACEGKDGSLVGENKKDAASSKKDIADCKSIDEPKIEKEIDKATENVETIEQNKEAEKETKNEAGAVDSKEDEQPKSNEESQKQPDGKEEPAVNEPKETNPTDKSTINEVIENSIK